MCASISARSSEGAWWCLLYMRYPWGMSLCVFPSLFVTLCFSVVMEVLIINSFARWMIIKKEMKQPRSNLIRYWKLMVQSRARCTVHDCKLSLCLTTSLTCCAHGELELFVQKSQLLAHVFKSYSLWSDVHGNLHLNNIWVLRINFNFSSVLDLVINGAG